MTPEQIKKATIQKVDLLMSSIVKDFEDNKNLSYNELSQKWSDYKDNLNFERFSVICEILTDNGVVDPFKKNSDNVRKASVVQISYPIFDDYINEYYYTKIKPIINVRN